MKATRLIELLCTKLQWDALDEIAFQLDQLAEELDEKELIEIDGLIAIIEQHEKEEYK